jgi:hypothetical protein
VVRAASIWLGVAFGVACGGTEGAVVTTRSQPGSAGAAATSWQIQLTGDVDTSFDVAHYEIDADSPAEIVAALRARGRTVACYFSAGTREPFRADAAGYPPSAVGDSLPDYPDENWLDIRDATVRALMTARLDPIRASGCDAVVPANLDGYLGVTGFPLTETDALEHARLLASAAHARGLRTVLSGGDESFVAALTGDYDWGRATGCVMTTGCAEFAPLIALGRPVFAVEFGDETSVPTICPRAAELRLEAILKHPELDAFRVGCP